MTKTHYTNFMLWAHLFIAICLELGLTQLVYKASFLAKHVAIKDKIQYLAKFHTHSSDHVQ